MPPPAVFKNDTFQSAIICYLTWFCERCSQRNPAADAGQRLRSDDRRSWWGIRAGFPGGIFTGGSPAGLREFAVCPAPGRPDAPGAGRRL